MRKVKVLNVKTGRIVELTEKTYKSLISAGKSKDFDLLEDVPKPKKAQNVQTEEIPTVDTNKDGKRSAAELIEAIDKAKTKKAIDVLIDGESRKTVLKAAAKRKTEL
jgi:hypothetical protein